MPGPKHYLQHKPKASDPEQELSFKIASLLGEEILAVEEVILDFTAPTGEAMQELVAHVVRNRGKRLRPLLVLLSAFNGGEKGSLYRTAAAVELIHTASLLHDDVIDGAQKRRGEASLNVLYGDYPAVLAGDYFFARAFELVSLCYSAPLIRLLSSAISTMCEGEIEQARNTYNCYTSEQQYLRCAYGKTAVLLEACCEAGALLSERDEKTVLQLRLYGRNLGMAFQITDDLLDICGNPEVTGKPAGSDLREGTITLPFIYILEDPRWGNYLRELINNRDFAPEKLSFLSEPACQKGPLARARQRANAYAREAAKCLRCLERTPAREIMEGLASYILQREK